VNWILGSTVSALPLVKAGRLRALAVTTAQRNKALPDVPTVAESGVPGYVFSGWVAMFAPAGTPMALVEKLGAETRRSLQDPEVVRRAEAEGSEILASSPRELARIVKSELQTWRDVARNGGIKP
jgi:tripartite-type tricarboxylate transporter receptor subunit TctC